VVIEKMAEERWQFEVPVEAKGTRLDAWLHTTVRGTGQALSRELVKGWIKAGNAVVNGVVCKRPNTRLGGGETVDIAGEVPASSVQPETGELVVLHRDADLLVLNKPAGLVVHPAPGVPDGTLANRLVSHFPEMASMDAFRPGIVHRLDKDTTGLLLVALNEGCRLKLSEDFAARNVDKEYVAIVRGCPKQAEGTINLPMGRDPSNKTKMAVIHRGGKTAVSMYRTLHADPGSRFSVLAVRIITGRTHQIRVHLSQMGHPVWGDVLYGGGVGKDDPLLKKLSGRQMLHARRIAFHHPTTEERLEFLCPPPEDFLELLSYLTRRTQQIVVTGMPGCGKSSLLALLEKAGLPVFNADKAVAQLYEPGQDGWDLIRRRFGEEFVPDDDTPVDKGKLFRAMRQSQNLCREIMDMIHPLTFHRLEAFQAEHSKHRVVAAEVPLYLEAGRSRARGKTDVVVGVHSPENIRRERLRQTRGWDDETFAAVTSWQWPEADKMRGCDLVVDNSDGLEELKCKAHGLLRTLTEIRRGKARRFDVAMRELLAPSPEPES
jgi:23S rRNA pseudouridine1911/1915/1917 synthase